MAAFFVRLRRFGRGRCRESEFAASPWALRSVDLSVRRHVREDSGHVRSMLFVDAMSHESFALTTMRGP